MADLTPANASAEHVMYTGPLLVKRLTKDLSTFVAGGGFSGDGGGFSYTNAVKNVNNAAYRRIYGGKFNYGSY